MTLGLTLGRGMSLPFLYWISALVLLTGQSIVLLVFFIPYVLFQLPSSVLVRNLGARGFLSAIAFAWVVMMMM